jgi:hypothetical protein
MTLRRFLQENFGWDTSIFAYLTPAKPIKRGGYAVTTYRKGRPEEGFFDSWQHMGSDCYRCVKYYDEKPETITLPAGEYHNTTLSEDDTTPHVEVRKARYFNRYLTDAEVDEQVAQMRSKK